MIWENIFKTGINNNNDKSSDKYRKVYVKILTTKNA